MNKSPYPKPFSLGSHSRRGFLQVGLISGLGLSLGDFFKMQARGDQKFYESKEGKAKSVIHIFLPGGMAHQESFDPKPLAPSEYRGPYAAINSKVDGIQLSELWKNTAGITDKITICRSMTHGEAAHERGTHNMFTGYRPSPALQYPSLGSVVSHEFGTRKNLPPYVCIPSVPNEFAGSGYLSTAYGPFSLGSDPADAGFKVQDLSLPAGITEDRFNRRRSILQSVDYHFKSKENSDKISAMDTFYQDAYKLISSPEARDSFNIDAEKPEVRDAYGRNPAGQRLLMARRLVESGVRFVSVNYGGWDHHDNIKDQMAGNVPAFDQAYARLITDLDERGLLDSTLVMVSSEFGRTPKINATGGRDHFPTVFSILLAGGGIKRGYVHGSSDALGAAPENDPLTVEDLAFTIYNQLGINADKELMSPGSRPIEIVAEGKVVTDLIA